MHQQCSLLFASAWCRLHRAKVHMSNNNRCLAPRASVDVERRRCAAMPKINQFRVRPGTCMWPTTHEIVTRDRAPAALFSGRRSRAFDLHRVKTYILTCSRRRWRWLSRRHRQRTQRLLAILNKQITGENQRNACDYAFKTEFVLFTWKLNQCRFSQSVKENDLINKPEKKTLR